MKREERDNGEELYRRRESKRGSKHLIIKSVQQKKDRQGPLEKKMSQKRKQAVSYPVSLDEM